MNRDGLARRESDDDAHSAEQEVFSFGPFKLFPAQRLLERSGQPVKIGGRAFDILVLLVRRASEVVTQREIHSTVWSGLVVDKGSLRFHMSALRKALGGGQPHVEYLVNVPRRGYSFVAPITGVRAASLVAKTDFDVTRMELAHNVPPALARMIGRNDTVRDIGTKLLAERFVTIVGPGGMGKTTVAIALSHTVLTQFSASVRFVDMGSVREPRQVATAVAVAIGLKVRTNDPNPSILEALRSRHMLLIFDSCEHVLDAVTPLVEQIFACAPQVFILATSREPLGAEGEHVFRLPPLQMPPEGVDVHSQKLMEYSAPQLFLERVRAGGTQIDLKDSIVDSVVAICRRLDGMALAIELAAGRVQAYGIHKTADLLGNQFSLLWPGRRTALPRHQTLMATLDWSYNLLSSSERRLLYRLSVFIGSFDLEAIRIVAMADASPSGPTSGTDISSLVARSLANAEQIGELDRYRLLDTTRGYGLGKLAESGEMDETTRRHAKYYEQILIRHAKINQKTGDWPHALASSLNDIRAAMNWAMSKDGDVSLGVRLSAYSASLWLGLGLLPECRDRMERALAVADQSEATAEEKILIQMALASAVTFTVDLGEAFRSSWMSVLNLAEEVGDKQSQLTAYMCLWAQQIRIWNGDEAFKLAQRCNVVADEHEKAGPKAMALWMLGLSEHHTGLHDSARLHLEKALSSDDPADRLLMQRYYGYDRRVDALGVLSNTLWLRGYTADALETSTMAVAEAREIHYPVPLCIALSWHCFNLYVIGAEWREVERHASTLTEHARRHGIDAYEGFGACLQALSGRPDLTGEEIASAVASGVRLLVRGQYAPFIPIFRAGAVMILAQEGLLIGAETLFATTLNDDRNPDHWCRPEIVRIKGHLAMSRGNSEEAELCFRMSIDWAARHGSLAWQLRSANSLAALWIDQGRRGLVGGLLSPLLVQFKKGIVSRDLQTARALLKSTQASSTVGAQ
jgi:predicted ATPase/DNA-binding winged helix-turn-helix (wHTH) protein